MPKKQNYSVFKKAAVFLVAVLTALMGVGCRRAPAENTQYYEREIVEMRRQQMLAQKSEPPVKEGYPWRGKEKESCLPCRIKTMEKSIKVEIDYLHETVREKKKTRLRLRD